MAKRRNKTRDMARSILPCRNRKAARQGKARVARRGRRRAKQALRSGEDGALEQVDRERRIHSSWEVLWRRGGDKVNHFCRWGRARTKHLPPEERVSALRSQLGAKGLIVDHALEHFQHAIDGSHLENRRARQAARRETREEGWVAQGRPFASEVELRALLEAALEVDHGRLNVALKTLSVRSCDRDSPCRDVDGTTACKGKPIVRVRLDVLCVARRLWRTGSRFGDSKTAVDEALIELFVELGLLSDRQQGSGRELG